MEPNNSSGDNLRSGILSSLDDQLWMIATCAIWALALILTSILLIFDMTENWAGFLAVTVIFYIQVYSHYLVSFRYFLNEYYMCAILHYMSYDSVKNSARKTVARWA